MRLLSVAGEIVEAAEGRSAMKRFPAGSTAMAAAPLIFACVAAPPSPLKPFRPRGGHGADDAARRNLAHHRRRQIGDENVPAAVGFHIDGSGEQRARCRPSVAAVAGVAGAANVLMMPCGVTLRTRLSNGSVM
jgi:hypothetical protein